VCKIQLHCSYGGFNIVLTCCIGVWFVGVGLYGLFTLGLMLVGCLLWLWWGCYSGFGCLWYYDVVLGIGLWVWVVGVISVLLLFVWGGGVIVMGGCLKWWLLLLTCAR